MTIEQLKDLLSGLHAAQKSDADVAAALQNVELTEQLTSPAMDSLAKQYSGSDTAAQLFVLEIRSAALAPPAADIPAAPAPDAAAQKAILDKAFDYSGKTFAQLPAVSATKTVRRFQDNPPLLRGITHSVPGSGSTPILYEDVDDYTVTIRDGAETNPLLTVKKPWGENGVIVPLGQQPILSKVLDEAQGSGRISFVRWESINGLQAAVFSFAVDKKKSHFAVNYCCFPEEEAVGGGADKDLNMRGGTSAAAGGFTPKATSVQAGDLYPGFSTWKPVKSTVPYHGEFAVDPNSGVVVRLTTVAEFKGGWVHQENQRIDYAQQKVGDKTLVLPVRYMIDTVEQPFGDTESKDPSTRHTLFTAAYKDYKPAN
ncbi:MAG: hypothetical protein ABR976_16995 [Terracidiphilus sp.]|jgi:hypothetical protein